MVQKLVSSPWLLLVSSIILIGTPWLREPAQRSVDILISPDSEARAKVNVKKIHLGELTGKAAIFNFEGTVFEGEVHAVKTKFRSGSRSTRYVSGPFKVDGHGQFSGMVQVGSEFQSVSREENYTFELVNSDNAEHETDLLSGQITATVNEVPGRPKWFVIPAQVFAALIQIAYVWARLRLPGKPSE